MRFIVDECTGPSVAKWLAALGHDVCSVYDHLRGIDDDSILAMAVREDRILITLDRDFSYKVFRERREHRGIVFLRLRDERAKQKQTVLDKLLRFHAERLANRFVVVTETMIRFVDEPKQ